MWNVFFEDARIPFNACGFNEIVYADDLNAFRPLPLATSNAEVLGQVARCQDRLHTWGEAVVCIEFTWRRVGRSLRSAPSDHVVHRLWLKKRGAERTH